MKHSLSELRNLRDKFCEIKDALQFNRAPYFWQDKGQWYFSDLRFERASRERSFARIKIHPERKAPCPPSLVPWEPPFALDPKSLP